MRFLLLFFLQFLFLFGPSSKSAFSAPLQKESSEVSPVQKLRLTEFKRALRLSGKTPLLPASLLKAYDENRFKQVVKQIDALPNAKKTAAVYLLYGNSLVILGEKEQSVAAYQSAYRRAALPQERAAAMANFGLVFSLQQRWKEAVAWVERALEVDRESHDRTSEGIDLSLLGTFYYRAGDGKKGAASHRQALEIAETSGDKRLKAHELTSIGNLYYLDGSLGPALKNQVEALQLFRDLHDPLGEGIALTSLSLVYKDQKALDSALTYRNEALALHQKLNDRAAEANDWINIGLILQDQQKTKEAIEAEEKALQIQESLGDSNGMAETEGTLGMIEQTAGRLPEAIRRLERSRDLFRKAGATQQIHVVEEKIQTIRDQMRK